MVSKNLSKFIKSLKIKKYRDKERCFLVEGRKNVLELLKSNFQVKCLVGTADFFSSNKEVLKMVPKDHVFEAKAKELSELGTFKTNEDALAVGEMRPSKMEDLNLKNHVVVLDGISDPGNLGTIIRTLDWFGFDQLVCSENTTDFYNPKVINATMGSFTRVKVYYTDICELLGNSNRPVYGADMEGTDPAKIQFTEPSFVVLGSESQGLSQEVLRVLSAKVSIPRYGKAESLNVGIAAGIIISHLRN